MENTSASSRLPQFIYIVLGLILAGLIVWASFAADIGQSFGAIAADPWGLVALVDLYLGFAIFWAFLFLVDGFKPTTFVWAIALLFLGNVLAVVWLVWRWNTLSKRLAP